MGKTDRPTQRRLRSLASARPTHAERRPRPVFSPAPRSGAVPSPLGKEDGTRPQLSVGFSPLGSPVLFPKSTEIVTLQHVHSTWHDRRLPAVSAPGLWPRDKLNSGLPRHVQLRVSRPCVSGSSGDRQTGEGAVCGAKKGEPRVECSARVCYSRGQLDRHSANSCCAGRHHIVQRRERHASGLLGVSSWRPGAPHLNGHRGRR